MRRAPLLPALALAALLAWLVGYPLLMTLLEALGGSKGWTLHWFGEFIHRPDEWLALWRSLWISAASVLLAALIGIPLAFLFERTEFTGRRVLGAIVALPVALPPLVGVIAFLFLYGESGFVSRAVQALLRLEDPPWRLTGPLALPRFHPRKRQRCGNRKKEDGDQLQSGRRIVDHQGSHPADRHAEDQLGKTNARHPGDCEGAGTGQDNRT